MIKSLLRGHLFSALFVALGLVCLSLSLAAFGRGDNDVPVNAGPVDVETATAALVTEPLVINAVGHMRALRSVELSFEVSGYITHILVKSGHRVQEGQVIAQLDDQSDIAKLTSLKAAYSLAQSTYERTVALQKYGAISMEELDQNRAKMVAAQSAMQQQQVLISQKTLRAPFPGVLGSLQIDQGAYVAAGAPLVRLVQEAPLRAVYSIPASQRPQLEIGQSVSVSAKAYPNQVFHGILDYISPEVSQATGTVQLQAKVDNENFLLMPGMFVSVTQTLDANRKLLMIPDIALMTDIQGEYVFKVVGQTAEKVYVKVGLITPRLAEIQSGLKPGDVVVVAGQQQLTNNSEVRVLVRPSVRQSTAT